MRKLTALLMTAATTAASILASEPARAQVYGYGNGWRQPMQSGPVIQPSQSGSSYRRSYPVMQQPNFGQPRRMNNPGSFGHRSGNTFGW